nr:hypothetical protein [uncultured Dialister sp.]
MNNKEYMEYEGYRIIEAALLSYTSPAGSLLSAAPGNHGLVWDYILFRLYLAEKTIRRFPSGFGCMDEMASGLREGLSHLPLTLRTLSLLKNLEGSSLILGIGSLPDEGKVKQRFHEFHELEKACSGSMEKMVASLASLSGCRADGKLISYLSAETKAFLSHLSVKLSSLTPCRICQGARKFTPSLPAFAEEAGEDSSLFALLTGLALSCLVLLLSPLSKTKRLEYNENIGK